MDKIIFPAGNYFIGDIGYALGIDFPMEYLNYDNLRTGLHQTADGRKYWIAKTKHRGGTLYTEDGRSWGFDHGCIGCMLLNEITSLDEYRMNGIEFDKPFEVSADTEEITIGHLKFSYDLPKDKEVKTLHISEINFYND